MGPVKGMKKRKKAEKKVDQNVLAAAVSASSSSASLGSQPQPSDWWDAFSRRISGNVSEMKDAKRFESIFKISRKTFDYVCSLVKEDMKARQSNFSYTNGRLLSLTDQVAVAIRRLGSGESLSNIGDSFGINQSTVSQITWRFVESLEQTANQHIQWPATEEDRKEIKSKFEKISGLPNCCGALDITHIVMNIPAVDPSNNVWLDREKNYSMILQAIVDPDMRFLDVNIGWPGSLSDTQVLKNSTFFKLAEEGKRLNGNKRKLLGDKELREYVVGDSGFPLLPWLITPYQAKPISDYQAEFNRRHCMTRMVVENALARLKETWRIIHGVMWMPDRNRLPKIVFACCLLHNIVIDMEDELFDDVTLSHHHDMGYRQQKCEHVNEAASVMSDELCVYLWGKDDKFGEDQSHFKEIPP